MFDDIPIITKKLTQQEISQVNTPKGVITVYRCTGIDRQGRAWEYNRTKTIFPNGGVLSAPHDFRPLTNE